MKHKLILFDLDGTLLDTSPGIYNGLDYMAPLVGREPLENSVKQNFIGPPLPVSFSKYLDLEGDELKEAIRIYRDFYRRLGYKMFDHYPGIKELLIELKNSGYLLGVVTMKEKNVTKQCIEESGLNEYFDLVLGNSDFDAKTKAQLIEQSLDHFKVDPKETILIGDTKVDSMGANEAGVDFVPALYGFGFTHNDTYDEYPYLIKLENPTDLINFLVKEE